MVGVNLPLKKSGSGGGGGFTQQIAIIQERQSQGTNGGDFTSGSKQDRAINTVTSDPDSIVTLDVANKKFTLGPGKYLIEAIFTSFFVGNNMLFIENVTDSQTEGEGGNGEASSSFTSDSYATANVSITADKDFKIQHQCQTTRLADGMGNDFNFSGESEIYGEVIIRKYADA